MRDSALKPAPTIFKPTWMQRVGEELMRDSALKRRGTHVLGSACAQSEKSSCATAL